MNSNILEISHNIHPIHVDVLEKGVRSRSKAIRCVIDENLIFNTASLESFFFEDWEPVLHDSLMVAAAVEFCDKSFRRPFDSWGRHFEVTISVHDPDRWNHPNISMSLHEALTFLTGDVWNISFVGRKENQSPPLKQLHFKLEQDIVAVIPFSNGLDSYAVSGLMAKELGKRLALIRLKSNDDSSNNSANNAFTAVPFRVREGINKFPESSARSRGFKFAIVSSLAAYLSKSNRVILPESGQGVLGPALIPVGQCYEDYRSHPLFTKRMEKFIFALLGVKIEFSIPRLWSTKGQTIRDFIEQCPNGSDRWAETKSCWQQNRQSSVNGKWRHCGFCAACMLRRMSIHAAGLQEQNETYLWENLNADFFEQGAAGDLPPQKIIKSFKEYAIAGVLFLDDLANFSNSALSQKTLQLRANQLSVALGIKEVEARDKMDTLLNNHAREWSAFTGSLGSQAYLKKWTRKIQ